MDIDYIIGLYLNDQASEDQLEILNKWIEESSDNAMALNKLEKIWLMKSKKSFYFNENEVSDRVWNRLHPPSLSKRRFLTYKTFFRSAGFFLLAAFSFLLYHGLKSDILQRQEVTETKMEVKSLVVKSNPRGVKSTIRLPDGSTVILNAESTLRYNFQANDTIRYIELEGEAYFKVMKDANRPFIVQSGSVRTVALGTEFNVKSYANEATTNVSLNQGKVQVTIQADQEAESYYLNPGQCLEYDSHEGRAIKNTFDNRVALGWTDGVICFKKDSLQQVMSKLSRWYDVNFELKNYHGTPWKYTGEFQDEYLDVILKSMSYSQHFDYKITKGNVIVNFKN